MSEDCFPQRAGAVEIHHMHHHHILPLRLPLSVNRHGALEGDGPQPSQALVDHYPQHAARVQMRGGGGRKCFKDKAAAFSCRPWQARTHHHRAPTAAAAVLSSTGVVAVCGCVQSLSYFVE